MILLISSTHDQLTEEVMCRAESRQLRTLHVDIEQIRRGHTEIIGSDVLQHGTTKIPLEQITGALVRCTPPTLQSECGGFLDKLPDLVINRETISVAESSHPYVDQLREILATSQHTSTGTASVYITGNEVFADHTEWALVHLIRSRRSLVQAWQRATGIFFLRLDFITEGHPELRAIETNPDLTEVSPDLLAAVSAAVLRLLRCRPTLPASQPVPESATAL